jgi:hypothetical protein
MAKVNVDELTIDGTVYVPKDKVKREAPAGDKSNPYMEPGKVYFIRTVTHYFTGRLIWVGNQEIVIEDACWIADTGRFNEFLKDGSKANETEPFPAGAEVVIGRGSIIDMVEFSSGLLLGVK